MKFKLNLITAVFVFLGLTGISQACPTFPAEMTYPGRDIISGKKVLLQDSSFTLEPTDQSIRVAVAKDWETGKIRYTTSSVSTATADGKGGMRYNRVKSKPKCGDVNKILIGNERLSLSIKGDHVEFVTDLGIDVHTLAVDFTRDQHKNPAQDTRKLTATYFGPNGKPVNPEGDPVIEKLGVLSIEKNYAGPQPKGALPDPTAPAPVPQAFEAKPETVRLRASCGAPKVVTAVPPAASGTAGGVSRQGG